MVDIYTKILYSHTLLNGFCSLIMMFIYQQVSHMDLLKQPCRASEQKCRSCCRTDFPRKQSKLLSLYQNKSGALKWWRLLFIYFVDISWKHKSSGSWIIISSSSWFLVLQIFQIHLLLSHLALIFLSVFQLIWSNSSQGSWKSIL